MALRPRADDDRLVEQVAAVCARAQEPLLLLERVAAAVRRRVPYDSAGWLLVDPDTLLITGVYEEDVPREAQLALIELELTAEDVNKFVDLGRARVPAAALSATTEGHLDRCARWTRVYGPAGFGDELRAVFRTGRVLWGHACLTRRADRAWFSRLEVELLARLSPHVAHGIRTALLLHESWAEDRADGPALLVLDDDGRVESATPEAMDRLGPVEDGRLDASVVVHEVAAQARALADRGAGGPPAVARTRAATGEWLLVRATRLAGDVGRTAVLVEPARRSDVAPLLLHLHELTTREREVTCLLLTGMATADIARELWITPETLRGHVKAVFAKLGVGSRAELFARLSHEPPVRSAPGS
ncbi:helix-turn-helix transcriptional regulator [Ornithinimicrobium kibberense]|uniref:LuxR C-terminal-related transcriptional regulator n=1 Tax=Ornithinimicrobium kibberense TaxID=282060 RepID=A0ABV5V5B3_9MICO|nr:helix-turn-helix transcriptional regulator [Ornithinimicrobium kibberense]